MGQGVIKKVVPPTPSRFKSWICWIRRHYREDSVTDHQNRSWCCRRCGFWISTITGKIVRGQTNLLAPTIGSGILSDGTHWDSAQARMRKDQHA